MNDKINFSHVNAPQTIELLMKRLPGVPNNISTESLVICQCMPSKTTPQWAGSVQRLTKRLVRGCENFVLALA